MTNRYVGPGGSDAASGLTWALRKETLNGVEDSPVASGDIIYVGPGVYRETLTVDVTGSPLIIRYIADVTGKNTDGVGGKVRITGSDDDDTFPNARSTLLTATGKENRSFDGFYFGETAGGGPIVNLDGSAAGISDWEFIRCVFAGGASSSADDDYVFVDISFEATEGITFEECIFLPGAENCIQFYSSSGETGLSGYVRNCLFLNPTGAGVLFDSVHSNAVYGCTFMHGNYGIRTVNLTFPRQVYAQDCRFIQMQSALTESGANTITADYVFFDGTGTDVSEGGNSITSFLPYTAPLLLAGYKLPWARDQVVGYNDNIYLPKTSGQLTTDLHGLARTLSSKVTRSALQYQGVVRDTSEYKFRPSSAKLADAGLYLLRMPVGNGGAAIEVSCWVKREADYAGTNPTLTISYSTVSDSHTDAGSAGSWNKLVTTLTPGSGYHWLQIELRSDNTATSGNYAVWFDSIRIKTQRTIPTMQWITNEIPLFLFDLNVKDPWVSNTIPIVTTAPSSYEPELFHPFPSFFRS
jgi:hypothetical protein